MITLRPSSARGRFDFGWLDTRHTFSFGRYFDPAFMGFRSLRVINEDRVTPGQGFGEHPHADMEILSYVLSGQLAHRDSMGNTHTVGPGEVQLMSAGSGVEHSEFNPSKDSPVHFLQIWIKPARAGARPSYDQRAFPIHQQTGRLHLIASPDATMGNASGPLRIGQDVRISAGVLCTDQSVDVPLAPGRFAWIQVARGSLVVNGQTLQAGDGGSVIDETALSIRATSDAELLVFDLA